jgi:hypothetical protein
LRAYEGFQVRNGFSSDTVMRLHQICRRGQSSCMLGSVFDDGKWILNVDAC